MLNRKKRILVVSECHRLASGFGTYAKEILSRLSVSNKYEVAELACYASPTDFQNTDWLVYGNGPLPEEKEYIEQHKNPVVQWGSIKFEYVCLDFKPDIVIAYRDPWMDSYIAESAFLPFFKWIWMPTVDSAPQKIEWLYNFNRCDLLLAYSEFGIKTLAEQTNNRLVVKDCASPAIDPQIFNIVLEKGLHKKGMGLDEDSIIFGTVMRNQKRKMFPELMVAFKEYLKRAPSEIAKRSFLYLHTSYPEKIGWKISSLIHEHGLSSKVICTYKCRACSRFFCSYYRDAIGTCSHCGELAATLPAVSNGVAHFELPQIYNLIDLYVQYACCEGFGIPCVEAAACGVPVAAIDYSAMSDVVKHTGGYAISPNLNREMETNADRSAENNEELTKIMLSFVKQNKEKRSMQRLKTRSLCLQRYTWDKTSKIWEKYIDEMDISSNLPWNHPALLSVPEKQAPKGCSNLEFCEWLISKVIQDSYHLYSFLMLDMAQDLNFGAKTNKGTMEKISQESLFKEYLPLGEKRYSFDLLRSGGVQSRPQRFLAEAHARLKK